VGVVTVQFVLGWLAFLLGGRGIEAASPEQAILRTLHQANGAALIALLTALWLASKRLARTEQTAR
jgi:hypothetical protein